MPGTYLLGYFLFPLTVFPSLMLPAVSAALFSPHFPTALRKFVRFRAFSWLLRCGAGTLLIISDFIHNAHSFSGQWSFF